MIESSAGWRLTFNDLLASAGIAADDALLIRHTFGRSGLPARASRADILAFTREQCVSTLKFPATPPRYWFIFAADGGSMARLIDVCLNEGEVTSERTHAHRYFALSYLDVMADLQHRLVIDWGRDAINWAKRAAGGNSFPVLEIADRRHIPFPGYDEVLLRYDELPSLVDDARYREWRTALRQVQGVYLITDSSDGRQYVGKASGGENIFGRWAQYAHDGHGGNVELKELMRRDPDHRRWFRYSLLRVFGPHTPESVVLHAEAHYKAALMTTTFGLNRN